MARVSVSGDSRIPSASSGSPRLPPSSPASRRCSRSHHGHAHAASHDVRRGVHVGLNKLGIYRKKRARERRFQDVDVIRDNIRSVAMSDARCARARRRPRRIRDHPARAAPPSSLAGCSPKERSPVPPPRSASTAWTTPPRDAASPRRRRSRTPRRRRRRRSREDPPELRHMASLHAVYGGVRRRVKGTGGRGFPDVHPRHGRSASSDSDLSDDEAADDLDARARDAAATAASLAAEWRTRSRRTRPSATRWTPRRLCAT